MQLPASSPQRTGGLPYKWIVAGVVIFGLFMTILDSTIVNIAIPSFQNVFGASLTSVQWVLTAYTLVQGVATPFCLSASVRSASTCWPWPVLPLVPSAAASPLTCRC
jgi:MFS family permease